MPSLASDAHGGKFSEVLEQGLEQLKSLLLTEYNKELDEHAIQASLCKEGAGDLLASDTLIREAASDCGESQEPSLECVSNHEQFSVNELDDKLRDQGSVVQSMRGMDSMASDFFRPQVSFATSVFIEYDTPLERWVKLTSLLMRPSSRMSLGMLFTRQYSMHEVWSNYLMKLRHNEAGCQKAYASAIAKIDKGRDSEEGAATASAMSLFFKVISTPRAYALIIHPDSYKRVVWIVLTLVVLLMDIVMVPMIVFVTFDDDVPIFSQLLWFSNAFWLIDIWVSCVSGRYDHGALDISLRSVALKYITTWLPFDISMVIFDWVLAIWEASSGEQPMGSLGIVLRCIRILRLLRLMRLGHLQSVLRDNTAINNKGLILFSGVVKITFGYAIYFHFVACIWYGIGLIGGDGWCSDCKRSFHSSYCYFTALHWAVTQLHGTTNIVASTTLEWACAGVSQFIGLILLAFFLGRTGHAVTYLVGVDRMELRQRGSQYIKKHNLSARLAQRFMRYIDAAGNQVDVGLQVRHEFELLSTLPDSLRSEILEEARKPHLSRIKIVGDLEFVSRKIVKRICSEAIQTSISMGGEVVFATGDFGTHWRVVDAGFLFYINGTRKDMGQIATDIMEVAKHDEHLGKALHKFQFKRHSLSLSTTSSMKPLSTLDATSLVNCVKSGSAKSITDGQSVSEMVLWTPWVHTGDLIATNDSVLHHLNLDDFHSIIEVRNDACLLTCRYAQRFVRQINEMAGEVSDLYQYRCLKREDSGDLVAAESHFAFLSHYKAEAGTEATLMQEGLQSMLEREGEDLQFANPPVFLDSNDLTDLTKIKDHVVNSNHLVLLLTPGVLSRPWCLIEIVTARNIGIPIIPVEIQRPGLQFQYPDEEFYAKLQKDLAASQAGNLLKREDILVEDVVDALRNEVFMQIALPFSPQRSKGVREAELLDILKRMMPPGWRPKRISTESKFLKTPSEGGIGSPGRRLPRKSSLYQSADSSVPGSMSIPGVVKIRRSELQLPRARSGDSSGDTEHSVPAQRIVM